MTDWQRPLGTAGDLWLVRASSVIVRENLRDCPTAKSSGVRPFLNSDPVPPRRGKALEDFTFAPLMASLDLVEHRNWSLTRVIAELRRTQGRFDSRRAPAHLSLLDWTAHVLPRYLAARAAEPDGAPAPHTLPVSYEWAALHHRADRAPDSRGVTHYEQTAWGRRYVSPDGTVRDLWLPSIGKARANRSEAERAAIAYVLARGLACPRPGFQQRYQRFDDQPLPPPNRVRVFGFGCGDGKAALLLDWGQEEVVRRYREHAAPAFARAVEGSGTMPGSSCIRCKALSGCTALPLAPGLWGGRPAKTRSPRRSLSAWDMRVHGQCPAQYHLTRQLNLTSLRPEHESATRGRVVDARLNDQHRKRPARGCREIAGPVDPGNWSAGGHELTGDSARDAAAMLAQHAALCPLDGLGPKERVLVQHQLSCYVPELDVVVIATPDLVHTRSGGWVWRETKTSTSRLWEGKSLMRGYPQLALAVLLLAAGVLGGELRRSRVELELLYPDDSTFEELDPSRPAVLDEARQVVADLAEPLLHDTSYAPRTGHHCHSCDARDWCRPGSEYADRNPLTAAAIQTSEDLI
ncbi:PD-(D/E)XK nuclease family protein [Umezawaea endophytica]|uniref:PD-(D/E)XK nuclease family protein n=1 Tax=Umezawaea endophytica TaxID=1654476 RepID=A0A9X2VY78_9PSEU|nr:PD-(D/E)XK nuclease family protein [Umezawaea endophytica]MCS7484811.1 PD-(D/E)XK nuclease family protein [Umezawaea endophytica]